MFDRQGLGMVVGAFALGLMACGGGAEGGGGSGGDETGTTSSSSTVSSTGGAGGAGGGGAAGGGGDTGSHFDDVHGEEHGCIHLDQGPFVPVTAAASADTAPVLDMVHTAYELTLQEAGGGSHDGFIRYESAENAAFYVFLSEDVDVSFADAQGNAITPEGTCEAAPCSSVCGLIENKYKLDLAAGQTTLSFGPTPTHDLLVLFEEAGHGH
jgi:hypothetical protein